MNTEYRHNYRIDKVENADPARAHENDELIKLNGKTYEDAFNDTLKKMREQGISNKVRKNATYGLQIVLTFSREDTEKIDIDAWKKANVDWLERTFNPPKTELANGKILETDNVVSVMYHGDEEGNVHLHAYVIPIDDKGKLNAKYYVDGPVAMRNLQNSYAEEMKQFGLERGLKNSIASHKAIKEYYASLNQIKQTTLPAPLEHETILAYRKRAEKAFQTAQMQWYNKVLKIERKLVEAITKSNNEKLELKEDKKNLTKEIHKIKKQLGDEDISFERIREVRKSAEREELFLKALEDFPDDEKAETARRLYNELILWQREINRQEEKRKEKEKESKKDSQKASS